MKITWIRTAVISMSAVTATCLWMRNDHGDASPIPLVAASATTQVTRNAKDLETLNAQMAAMAAQIAGLKRQQASAPTRNADAASPALTPEEAQHRGDEQADAQAALVEQAVVSERMDPNWAPAAENAIRRMFQDGEIESLQLVAAQCRATLCRIDIASSGASAGAEDFDQSVRKLLVHLPWHGQGFGRVYDPFGPAPLQYSSSLAKGTSCRNQVS